MPIASGAAGRVDVGVDPSTTWRPDGLKGKIKPVNRPCDSYLQRYQELKMRKERNKLLQLKKENMDLSDDQNEESKEEVPETTDDCEDCTSETSSSEERSKKSVLCVIL